MKFRFAIAALVFAAVALSACASKDEKKLEPMELTRIKQTVKIKRLWSVNVGGDAEYLRVALQPAGDGNRIYAASRDGNVMALDPVTGKRAWRAELDTELSSGPGVGANLVVVTSADGIAIALDSTTGAERWRANLGGESLARPAIHSDVVIVQTIDDRLQALSIVDGSERWSIEQSAPRLTMRGSASPLIVGDSVIAGFDNGRLVAVNIGTGDVEWDTVLSPPGGRSDLDRLADVDGKISAVGQDVYAAGYHGKLAAVAVESGQILWSHDISTYEGVSADWNNLYTVNENGEVIALTRQTGDESWRQGSLLRREPTVPVSFGTTVVVGDLEGYLHFFSNFDGHPVARVHMGGEAISADPIVVANRLYVQSDKGTVAAYVVEEPKRKERKAPDAADKGA